MKKPAKVLVLWNHVGVDIYERWRKEGPKTLAWDPEQTAPDVGTVTEEVDALVDAISESGYRVAVVNVEEDVHKLLAAIELYQPDVIFNLVEFFHDDVALEAAVAGLYELLAVPYTGCGPKALSTCQNKYRTKLILQAAGLPTPPHFIVRMGHEIPADHGLKFPLIVKPVAEDASGGVERDSVVKSQEELEKRIRYVWEEFYQAALVERYIEGREIHAALLGNDPPEVLPLFEMVFEDHDETKEWKPRIISYAAKWDPHTKEFYEMDAVSPPKDLPRDVAREIREIASEAFKLLKCRDYARIDMRVDEDGQPYILEVNPNPDLVEETAYMLCAAASGRTFPQTVKEIIELALRRGREWYGYGEEQASAAATEPKPDDVEYMPSETQRLKKVAELEKELAETKAALDDALAKLEAATKKRSARKKSSSKSSTKKTKSSKSSGKSKSKTKTSKKAS